MTTTESPSRGGGAPAVPPLTNADSARLRDQVREIEAATGLHDVFAPVLGAVDPEYPAPVAATGGDTDEPREVIVGQRDAMVRALALRDDPSQPEPVRAVWAEVVERLAEARRDAKSELAQRRREDPSEPGWAEVEAVSRDTAQRSELDRGEAGTLGVEATGRRTDPGPPDIANR